MPTPASRPGSARLAAAKAASRQAPAPAAAPRPQSEAQTAGTQPLQPPRAATPARPAAQAVPARPAAAPAAPGRASSTARPAVAAPGKASAPSRPAVASVPSIDFGTPTGEATTDVGATAVGSGSATAVNAVARPPSSTRNVVPPRPGSARLPARSGNSSRVRAAGAIGKGSSTSAKAVGKSSGSARGASSTRTRGVQDEPAQRRPRTQGGGIAKFVVLGVVLVLVIGAISFNPVRRAIALGKLDATRSDSSAARTAAADAFMRLVDGNLSIVTAAVVENRGPVDAQIYMAKAVKSFLALTIIAERQVVAPPAGGGTAPEAADAAKNVTAEERAAALAAAADIYDGEANRHSRLPSGLAAWARDLETPRPVADAAVRLIVTAKGNENKDFAPGEVLLNAAVTPNQDPERVAAAIAALAEFLDATNLNYAFTLLNSRVGDQALGVLAEKIVKTATPLHLPQIMKLLANPQPAVRAVAIEALGGPGMVLGDTPQGFKEREELGKTLAPKLAPDTPKVELAAAIKAVKGLRLVGARDALLALVPKLDALQLEGVDGPYMSGVLGKSLIGMTVAPAADDVKSKAEAKAMSAAADAASGDLITKLIAALDDDASRAVAAAALSLVSNQNYPQLRPALDKLAAHGEDAACFTTLGILTGKVYGREDVVKACGQDLEKWKAQLAKDKAVCDRLREILAYEEAHQSWQNIGDGKHTRKELGEVKDWLAATQVELDALVADKGFIAPIGFTKGQVSEIGHETKEMGKAIRSVWAGTVD